MATFVVSSLPCAKASGVAVSVAPASAAVPARKLLRCMLVVSEALAILLLRFYWQGAAGGVRGRRSCVGHMAHMALMSLTPHSHNLLRMQPCDVVCIIT